MEPAVGFELTIGGLRILSPMYHLVLSDSIMVCPVWRQTPVNIWLGHTVPLKETEIRMVPGRWDVVRLGHASIQVTLNTTPILS